MILTKGATKRLQFHLDRIQTMADELGKLIADGNNKFDNASKAWRKSDNAAKFSDDLDALGFIHQETKNLHYKISKELKDANTGAETGTVKNKNKKAETEGENDDW